MIAAFVENNEFFLFLLISLFEHFPYNFVTQTEYNLPVNF
jgi:hypothetical protein